MEKTYIFKINVHKSVFLVCQNYRITQCLKKVTEISLAPLIVLTNSARMFSLGPSKKVNYDEVFEVTGINNQRRTMYRCKYCFKFPDILKRGPDVSHAKLSTICLAKGATPYSTALENHLRTLSF